MREFIEKFIFNPKPSLSFLYIKSGIFTAVVPISVSAIPYYDAVRIGSSPFLLEEHFGRVSELPDVFNGISQTNLVDKTYMVFNLSDTILTNKSDITSIKYGDVSFGESYAEYCCSYEVDFTNLFSTEYLPKQVRFLIFGSGINDVRCRIATHKYYSEGALASMSPEVIWSRVISYMVHTKTAAELVRREGLHVLNHFKAETLETEQGPDYPLSFLQTIGNKPYLDLKTKEKIHVKTMTTTINNDVGLYKAFSDASNQNPVNVIRESHTYETSKDLTDLLTGIREHPLTNLASIRDHNSLTSKIDFIKEQLNYISVRTRIPPVFTDWIVIT